MKRFLICATVLALIACASFADACGRRGRGGNCGGGGGGGDEGCQSCGGGMQFVGYRSNCQGCQNCINCPQDCAANNCNCSFYGQSATPGFVTIQVCRGNRNCVLVDVPVTGAGTTWESFPDPKDNNLFALFHAGQQIGTWNAAERWYAPYDAPTRTFAAKQFWGGGSVAKAPSAVPTTADATDPFSAQGIGGTATAETSTPAEAQQQQPKFGAIWPSGSPSAESNVSGGRPTAPQVELPTDANLPFACLTSDDAALCAKFRQAWTQNELTPWKSRFRVKVYATNDPMLRDRDQREKWFAKPGLYFEDKDGIALGQMSIDDFAGDPPEMLAFALNQIDPQFNPALVVDLAHPPEPETLSDQFADAWPTIAKVAFLLAFAVTAAFACAYAFSHSTDQRGTNVPATFATGIR